MNDHIPPTRVQQFLAVVASRTTDAAHLRILKAAEADYSGAAIESELVRIIDELLHET